MQLLDVPYVPQSEALCGGAALAMVLRYWGKSDAVAEDFAALVGAGQAGIRTGDLVAAVEASGWTALPFPGTSTAIERQLSERRPVIALIRAGPNSFHYVVLVGWANGWVVVHDPSVGPFRPTRAAEFEAAWSATGSWALLVLPPREGQQQEPSAPPPSAAASSALTAGCRDLLEAGVLLAQQGDTSAAELDFLAVQSLCPGAAAPFRERAGLRFRVEDWAGASRLAEHALALDPSDAHARRLLAGSRFLAGDVEAALEAWNHLSEPRVDLTRVDGLSRIRYSAVTDQLDLPRGRVLTAQAFRRARRRLAEVPAQVASRLSVRPVQDGNAQVDVVLLERPAVLGGVWDAASAGVRAVAERELAFGVASPTGNGELWTAAWRWWEDRPRVAVGLTVPAAGGRPGIWRVEGFWERQAYAMPAVEGSVGAAPTAVTREERRRTSLTFADWLGPDVRLELGAAFDRWMDRRSHLAAQASVETRWASDRLAVGARVERWVGLAKRAPFGSGGLSCAWRSRGLDGRGGWLGEAGLSSATSRAPLALWSGAGTGHGRAPLLRAHPLLNGGVIEGSAFGRTLVHGTLERQTWPWTAGPVRMGWAVFVDAARSWDLGPGGALPWQVDAGIGLRLRGLAASGQARIDVAHGFEDGDSAISLGWQIP